MTLALAESAPLITPVLLAGGSGTRLWPLSRKTYPKQFAPLLGSGSLFQAAARRFDGPGFARPLIVTGSDFRAAVAAARPAALAGQIVTFGITPSRAETGYGWLELAEVPNAEGPVKLKSFAEKPDAATAQALFESDAHLWNAGLFLMTAQTVIAAFEAHAPALMPPVREAVNQAESDLGFLRLAAAPWEGLPDLSIDVAVMEAAENLSVVPFSGAWSDLGGWDAIWRASAPDAVGVAAGPRTTAIGCENTLLRSDSPGQELVGIGLKNILAVAMGDAVLVADRDRAQEVKLAVKRLAARAAPQATQFPRDHRPWGWFETLAQEGRFQVKRIVVKPGGILSLQSHMHRSEHWIVVAGTARVTVGEEVQLLGENASIYIPLGVVHRLENPGRLPMVLIEVQTGAYLGEDDIERHEDLYARG
jgi:mannose-1-phosphate guanylyltransferase/mannose-6-phosphate isomerase